MTETHSVGLIGLGMMGEAIAERYLEAGVDLIVYNRSAAAVERVVERGGAAAASVADLAERAATIITVLPEGADVRAVFEGDTGLLKSARPGTLLIDCSTVEPELSRSLARNAVERRQRFADAGLGGLPPDGRAGRLKIMYGALAEDSPAVEAILSPLAAACWRCGPPGSGMTTKLINNLVSTTIHVADLEAVTLAERAGLDVGVFLQVLQSTLADNRQLRDRIPGELADPDQPPGFRLDLAYKDAVIGLQLAERHGVPLMALSSGYGLIADARKRGYGSCSVAALLRTLRDRVDEAGAVQRSS